ncbi:GNAT family N-acetyltransferase [Paenibacillus alkalitolerans]|uniref:GNAT family N-acetyltransferase n=1 Tax=Paenibacillus alkalitolerans TaxID=2799335 RepID=UPI0018F38905|nr:GNAT family N-acetyltransferase [Paenibacillus alkalitolerans]
MTNANIRIEALADCTMNQAVEAWNEGFSDYYVPMRITPATFGSVKYGLEDIQPEHSFIAFSGDRPAGFLLSAIRVDGGVKTAWNGGTAVVPEFRRLGAGKALMAKALETYRKLGVEKAFLEAFVQNEKAIALYRSFGYETFDTLTGFRVDGETEPVWDDIAYERHRYDIRHVTPRELSLLPFYPRHAAWQTQWRSAKDGEAVVVVDQSTGDTAGYALYRRSFDAEGTHVSTSLLQCAAAPGGSDADQVLRAALRYVFSVRSESPSLKRMVFAAPSSQRGLVDLLENLGFSRNHQLVHMSCKP